MRLIKKIIYIYVVLNFLKNKKILFNNLNFKKSDFSNHKQIKSLIFKNNFYNLKNDYVQSFDFVNFSKKLGGEIGINISKKNIFYWYKINRFKINYPWSDDLTSKRLINLVYNYEFIVSVSSNNDRKFIDRIIMIHIKRVIYDFNNKKIDQITSFDIVASLLSFFILKKMNTKIINFLEIIFFNQIDSLGVHKSYNILEHSKFINNLYELKNIFLYFNHSVPQYIETTIIKMSSILNEYFHLDGSIPLFNGTNNNYTDVIHKMISKDEYFKSRKFINSKNGIAFYSDKQKKIFFDVVQPNKDSVSKNLSAGTLSIEISGLNEKIITNCGASESYGKNPEYLRYSAAHSTIILQNTNISEIKEKNPHIKFPQLVTFNYESVGDQIVFEGSHNGYVNKYNN